MSNRIKIGLIVDRMSVARWQADALRSLGDAYDLIVYSCENTRPGRRKIRHAAYYFLNLFTVRNQWTRRLPVPAGLPVVATRHFDAPYRGAWQQLTDDLLSQIRGDGPAAIVKFGMGLLEVPPQFAIPILSYHHGDPEQFRGRPAGFYELLSGASVMGQVVQRLSNALDSGDIVASAETKIIPHSYRATLVEAYRHSPLLLGRAIANCLAGNSWKPARWGRNYRLPTNLIVLRFVLERSHRSVSRLFYGLFKEKQWSVATTGLGDQPNLPALDQALAHHAQWRVLATPPGYRFLADPFFHPSGGLLVEGLNRRSCRGEILHVGDGAPRRLSGRGGHYSYPAPVLDEGRWHVVPETSDWSAARAYPLGETALGEATELRIPGRPALLDPTPFRRNGILYLFANLASEGASVLRLWLATGLGGEFSEHPDSPIRISPNGSRMAGTLSIIDGRLIRVGQDLRRGYGDGLSFFEVTWIDQRDYREHAAGGFRFAHCRGPHTLNLGEGRVVFDYYEERFSPLAGIRRLRERRAARRS